MDVTDQQRAPGCGGKDLLATNTSPDRLMAIADFTGYGAYHTKQNGGCGAPQESGHAGEVRFGESQCSGGSGVVGDAFAEQRGSGFRRAQRVARAAQHGEGFLAIFRDAEKPATVSASGFPLTNESESAVDGGSGTAVINRTWPLIRSDVRGLTTGGLPGGARSSWSQAALSGALAAPTLGSRKGRATRMRNKRSLGAHLVLVRRTGGGGGAGVGGGGGGGGGGRRGRRRSRGWRALVVAAGDRVAERRAAAPRVVGDDRAVEPPSGSTGGGRRGWRNYRWTPGSGGVRPAGETPGYVRDPYFNNPNGLAERLISFRNFRRALRPISRSFTNYADGTGDYALF